MPQPHSPRSSRSGAPSRGGSSSARGAGRGRGDAPKTGTKRGSGYGKPSDQARGAAKRRQETPSARTFRGREAADRRGEREAAPMAPARKGWGSLTRKGAAGISERGRESTRELERVEKPRVDHASEKWQRETGKQQPESTKPKKERPRFDLAPDAIKEIEARAGKRAPRLLRYLKDAGSAFLAERYGDAKKDLRPLLQETPDAPSVQELHGMILYRTGKWALATKELELSHLATRSFDLYPALMDCYRALHKWKKTEDLWDELRAESPNAEVTAEGRIVAAGAKADQNRLKDAIALMEKGPRPKNNPKEHHLRSWYVLADLYDRAGETSKARSLFQKIAKHDPDLADVLDRLDALGN